MVSFTPNSFVIEIPTSGNPYYGYVELQRELLNLLAMLDPNSHAPVHYHTLDLLQNLLLTNEQLRAMRKTP